MKWVVTGGVFGFLSVAFGAFGAHSLSSVLSDKQLATWHTAVLYQMFHAMALVGLGIFGQQQQKLARVIELAGWAFSVGTVLFSGSLFILSLTQIKAFGAITPIGGILFLIGWAALVRTAFQLIKVKKS